MKTENFLKNRRADEFSAEERTVLETALGPVKMLPPRHTIAHRGVPLFSSTLLIEGFMGRYMEDRDGDRQLVALHLPGDFVDLHAFPLKHLDHDVVTLTETAIATIDHAALSRITAQYPHLTRLLWFSTLLDAAMHREWIFRLGRLDGKGRVAHLLCETAARLAAVEMCDGREFRLPLNQSDIADACGLTNVHVNRVFRSLREEELVTMKGQDVVIGNLAGLQTLAEFDPQYLYIHG